MKVLVVDDSGMMRKILIRELLQMNFRESNIVQAADGEEAVNTIKQDTFDLILMDWNMPKMLGIDAVQEIRAMDVKTPILMVTTEAERANVVRAIQVGANNYLVKPFTNEDLREKVLQLVGELPQPTDSVGLPPQQIDLNTGRITDDL